MDNLFDGIAEVAPSGDVLTNAAPITGVDSQPTDTPIDLWSEGHPTEQQDLAVAQKYDAKNDPKRVEYWQSQADKAKAAVMQRDTEFKQKEQQFAELAELDAYLRSNPTVVEKLRAELGTDSPTVDAGLVKPVKPVAPEGYNEVEAFNDPNSNSWKHRKAVEQYRDNLETYYDKREETTVREQREFADRQRAQAQYQGAIRQTYAVLQQQHGLQPQEAQEFVQMFSDDSSITLDNLVKLYRTLKQPAPGKQPERIVRQVANSRIPAPVSMVTSQHQPDYSDEDMFNMGLYQAAGKSRVR